MNRLKVGLVGMYYPNFAAEEYGVYPQAVAGLEALSAEWGFELVAMQAGIQTVEQAEAAQRELEDAAVDLILVQVSSFALGELLIPFARMSLPLGLWGVPEPSLEGVLPLNSLTALNMFASILRVHLPDRETPFKWFYGQAEDARFRRRLHLTVRALTALKRLRGTRIALVGEIAPSFYNLAYDAQRFEERLGVTIEQIPLREAFQRARSYDAGDVAALAEQLAPMADPALESKWITSSASIALALRDLSDEAGSEAIALRCWPEFQTEMEGIGPCAAVGWLNETGLPTSCEGDVVGAISMLALRHLSEAATTMMDMVAVKDDTAIHLWHCGPTAPSLAGPEGARLVHHPTLDRDKPADSPRSGAAVDLRLARGPATVMRFSGAADEAFLLSGDVVDGPSAGYAGSRGWIANMRIAAEPASVGDLLETMAYHGLPHHYPLALGDWTAALLELCAWLGIRTLPRIPYRDHLVRPADAFAGSPTP